MLMQSNPHGIESLLLRAIHTVLSMFLLLTANISLFLPSMLRNPTQLSSPRGQLNLLSTMLLGIWLFPCQQVPVSNPSGQAEKFMPTGLLGMPSKTVGNLPSVLLGMPSRNVGKHPLNSPQGFPWENKSYKTRPLI